MIEDGDDTVKTDDKESVIKDTAWGYIIDYGEGVDGIAFASHSISPGIWIYGRNSITMMILCHMAAVPLL